MVNKLRAFRDRCGIISLLLWSGLAHANQGETVLAACPSTLTTHQVADHVPGGFEVAFCQNPMAPV